MQPQYYAWPSFGHPFLIFLEAPLVLDDIFEVNVLSLIQSVTLNDFNVQSITICLLNIRLPIANVQ